MNEFKCTNGPLNFIFTYFQTSVSSNDPPDEATAQAVANAFLKSVGESARNDGDQTEDDVSICEDNQVGIDSNFLLNCSLTSKQCLLNFLTEILKTAPDK